MTARTALSYGRATPDDFLEIAALDRNAWVNNRHGTYIPDGEHAWRIWVDHALVVCARDGELLAGAVLAFPCMDGTLCLHKVFVDTEYRGKGVASRLLTFLLGELDQRGATCFLTVDPENKAALKLYTGLGFRRTSFQSGYYRPEEDRLLLHRPAGEPNR